MRVTPEHWTLLIKFCEENPQLITNKFIGPEGKTQGHALWQKVSHQLNSLGMGEKSIEEWRKAFRDWKCKTKAKAAKVQMEIGQTDGGPANEMPLSDLETRLVGLMGRKGLEGDNVAEMGFGQITVNQNPVEMVTESPVIPQDHNYNKPSTSATCNAQGPTPSRGIKKKPRVIRQRQAQRITNRLSELSEETVVILRNIDRNTSQIADSLKAMADCMVKLLQK